MDRDYGLTYGRQLLDGRVIEHVHRERHFSDLPYVYRFVDQETTSQEDRHMV